MANRKRGSDVDGDGDRDGVKTDHVLSNARSLEAVCKCGSATVANTLAHSDPLSLLLLPSIAAGQDRKQQHPCPPLTIIHCYLAAWVAIVAPLALAIFRRKMPRLSCWLGIFLYRFPIRKKEFRSINSWMRVGRDQVETVEGFREHVNFDP